MLFQLSYGQKIGAGSRIRTRDLRLTKTLLYQLSYASNARLSGPAPQPAAASLSSHVLGRWFASGIPHGRGCFNPTQALQVFQRAFALCVSEYLYVGA